MIQASQEFQRGDWVRISADLGPGCGHFPCDREAVVYGSYADRFGGNSTEDYTLYVRGAGEVSWYKGRCLRLIERGRLDKLWSWQDEREEERRLKSDLNWIFENGEEVAVGHHGDSTEALARCLGMDSLWGSGGEGFVYVQRALRVLEIAAPFLLTGDKEGWLAAYEGWRNEYGGSG